MSSFVFPVYFSAIGMVAILLISLSSLSEQAGPTGGTTTSNIARSTTTEIDHFDRDHPVNVTGYTFTPFSINATWSLPNHKNQTELENFVFNYYKAKNVKDERQHSHVWLAADVTSYLLDKLKPGTRYSFSVVANYSLGHQPHSITYTITTQGFGEDKPCGCTSGGTVRDKRRQCHPITGQCECNDKHTLGLKCDHCLPGYLWSNVTGCQICICDKQRGTGYCSIDSDGIVKCNCHKNYGGLNCLYCAHNYYLVGKQCLACNCNNNTDPNYRACKMDTGVCIQCKFNTTGDQCDKCKEGYVGDAVSGHNCTSLDDLPKLRVWNAPKLGGTLQHHLGAILGACAAVLALILLVVGAVVYRHWWRWRRRPLQFWTVQLKEDRERVSFSTEHPAYQHVDGGAPPDDLLFYDQSGGGWCDEASDGGAGRAGGAPNGAGGRARPRTHAGDGANPYRCLEEL